MKKKNIRLYALMASAAALVFECVYPIVFIKWIVPLYAVCVLFAAGIAYLLFLALFLARDAKKPAVFALIGAAVYTAVMLGITPLVNNVIFGAVAPWGSVFVNAAVNLVFWLVMLRLIRKATGERFVVLPLVCVLLVVIGVPVTAVETAPNVRATGFIVSDTVANYEERMAQIDIYENTLETAVPQTQVYDLIMDHLKAPLPAGKTEKKVLVLGWDGCRADAMVMAEHRGAVDALLADGGRARIAYCGGANWPAPITQMTATVEGWTTMFTGGWSDLHGISGFDDVGVSQAKTFFVTAIEDGLIDSAAFDFSWESHLRTYANDVEYTKQKNLNVAWNFAEGEEGGDADEGTFQNALKDIQSPDCSDLIFTIFEYCDYYGHTYGFWNNTPQYEEAFRLANEKGVALIDAVKARPTYDTEDWLILISSDHGGYVRGHGGDTLQERMMFIVTNR